MTFLRVVSLFLSGDGCLRLNLSEILESLEDFGVGVSAMLCQVVIVDDKNYIA